jgi:hypothetical protein
MHACYFCFASTARETVDYCTSSWNHAGHPYHNFHQHSVPPRTQSSTSCRSSSPHAASHRNGRRCCVLLVFSSWSIVESTALNAATAWRAQGGKRSTRSRQMVAPSRHSMSVSLSRRTEGVRPMHTFGTFLHTAARNLTHLCEAHMISGRTQTGRPSMTDDEDPPLSPSHDLRRGAGPGGPARLARIVSPLCQGQGAAGWVR